MQGKLIFVTGGIRSGKSVFAEKITSEMGGRIAYIATAMAFDEEMDHRITIHRQRRPDTWTTFEEPHDVAKIIAEQGSRYDVLMLDCVTIMVSNLMYAEEKSTGQEFKKESQIAVIEKVRSVAEAAKRAAAHVVIVSNEVGMTLVSDNFLGRQYQELVGKANQIIAELSDDAYLVVAGYPINLKREGSANL